MSRASTTVETSAIVEVTVRVSLGGRGGGGWTQDCKVDQVHRQACDSALNRVHKAVGNFHDIQICGTPKVTAVIVDKEDRQR